MSVKNHIIFIGCGTGRSGTVTLSMLLDRCRGFHCTHEAQPMLPWKLDESAYKLKKETFLKSKVDVGDVHSVYLPYLEQFIKDIPNIKIVCTRRDSEEVADSFERHIDNGPQPHRNHWYEHNGKDGWQLDPNWDATFPKYNIKDRRLAIIKYAQEYDKHIDELVKKYPNNILIIQMTGLSTMSGQNKVFKFVGIKPYNRRFTTRRKSIYNSSRPHTS
jgi:hypothetical protein